MDNSNPITRRAALLASGNAFTPPRRRRRALPRSLLRPAGWVLAGMALAALVFEIGYRTGG